MTDRKYEMILMDNAHIIVPLLIMLLGLCIIILISAIFGIILGHLSCTESGQYYYILKNTV